MIRKGLRVVRGPNWKYGDQDGGRGHLGTVIDYKGDGKQVLVAWDPQSLLQAVSPIQVRYWYRTGQEECYDLRVFDSAAAGVIHPKIWCDNCKEMHMKGMRFKCMDCANYDLCTTCYMSNIHDRCHSFIRIDRPLHMGMKLAPRCTGTRFRAFNMKTTDWNGKRPTSGVLGYYKDQLPLLGVYCSNVNARNSDIGIGARVKVKVNDLGYKLLQVGNGGINNQMLQYRGSTGTVVHINNQGNTVVQYEGSYRPWTINHQALAKVGDCECALKSAIGGLLLAGTMLDLMTNRTVTHKKDGEESARPSSRLPRL